MTAQHTKHTEARTPWNSAKRLAAWAALIAALLMIPLITGMPWTGRDYLAAGSVLLGAAAGYEFAARNVDFRNRLIIGAATVAMVLFIWALAVAD